MLQGPASLDTSSPLPRDTMPQVPYIPRRTHIILRQRLTGRYTLGALFEKPCKIIGPDIKRKVWTEEKKRGQ